MLTLEEAVTIQVLSKQGRGVREMARELGVSRNTVRKYLRDGRPRRYGPRPARPSKLDAFEGYLRERLAVDARLEASVLCRELRERGYDGCESQVRARVAALKLSSDTQSYALRRHPPLRTPFGDGWLSGAGCPAWFRGL